MRGESPNATYKNLVAVPAYGTDGTFSNQYSGNPLIPTEESPLNVAQMLGQAGSEMNEKGLNTLQNSLLDANSPPSYVSNSYTPVSPPP